MDRRRYNSQRVEPPQSMWVRYRSIALGGLFIAVTACIAYFPALGGAFIWDDNTYVINSARVKASDGLSRIWFSTGQEEYYPISYTAFWLEWRLWRQNAAGYHITNLALHIAAALLIWVILRKLTIAGAFLAALLFAVHPVNVESVAWIFQCRGLLATIFFLLSIWWYLLAEEQCGGLITEKDAAVGGGKRKPPEENHGAGSVGRWYWLSLLAFLLAMLSKGSVAILPVVLLGIILSRRQLTRWDWLKVGPFFLVAAMLTAVNVWFQTRGSGEVIRAASFAERLAGAGAVVWFYLSKALAPLNLIFVYPQWTVQTSTVRWWLPLLAAIALTALLCWNRNRRWGRPLLFAWGFFCVALAPVMGFADAYFMKFSLVADHYLYVGMIGAMALAAAGWDAWHRQASALPRATALVTAVVVVSSFVLLSHQQAQLYSDPITLYQTTIEKNPTCWMAYNNLGTLLVDSGRLQEAMEHYQLALRFKPDYALTYNDIGTVLVRTGRMQEAIEHFQHALRLEPDFAEAHNNLGTALLDLGQTEAAVAEFQQALKLKPDLPNAYNNLGIVLSKAGRAEEAIKFYELALQINPDLAAAHNNLGKTLSVAGRTQEAIAQIRQALQLQPNFPEACKNLGDVLAGAGQLEEAVRHYQQALRLKPDFVSACRNLAAAYVQMNRPADAIAAAQKALAISRSTGQTASAEQIEAWLASYGAGQTKAPDAAPSSQPSSAVP